ncbi:MAG TPA: response regulator [Thermoanaerobaculia bacterium]|jgi:DNA-binding response OmpR family regulator
MDTLKTVLLVEDDEDLREVVRITLEKPTLHILEARDGMTAILLARQVIPHLILLDWMMPGMDGLEVIHALRGDPDTAGIRIIMLTARDQREDIDRGLEAGADAYLVKPFSPLELVRTVEAAL